MWNEVSQGGILPTDFIVDQEMGMNLKTGEYQVRRDELLF